MSPVQSLDWECGIVAVDGVRRRLAVSPHGCYDVSRMAVTRDEVIHLAKLSRIALTDAEVDQYAAQIASILGYVQKLEQEVVDLEQEAVANITGLENVFREDAVRASTPDVRERILAQFPLREGDLLKTRGVFRHD